MRTKFFIEFLRRQRKFFDEELFVFSIAGLPLVRNARTENEDKFRLPPVVLHEFQPGSNGTCKSARTDQIN